VASLRINVAVSVLFTLFGGPGILLALIPWRVTHFSVPADEPKWQVACGAVVIVAGLIPLLESIWRFVVMGRGTLVPAVPPEHLVVSGFYRYVRNPMYVGVLSVIVTEAILFRSGTLVTEAVSAWVAIELFVRLYEEPKLSRIFGDEYTNYRLHVRRWLPRLTPWESPRA
jgi:protein-S-isoprenylcysteine O-methyltransferase Ste14